MSPLRAELEMLLDHLDETQTRQMLAIVRILYDAQPEEGYSEEDDPFIKGIFHDSPDLAIRSEEILHDALPSDYRADEDPAIGLIDGPPDLAIRAEEIL